MIILVSLSVLLTILSAQTVDSAIWTLGIFVKYALKYNIELSSERDLVSRKVKLCCWTVNGLLFPAFPL